MLNHFRSSPIAVAAGGLLLAGTGWLLLVPAAPAVVVAEVEATAAPQPQLDATAATSSVDAMARRLEASPAAQAAEWELLARSYAALGRWREADRAFDKAIVLSPRNAHLLAERASAVLASREANAPERAARLVVAALALEPLQPTALALALDPALNRSSAR